MVFFNAHKIRNHGENPSKSKNSGNVQVPESCETTIHSSVGTFKVVRKNTYMPAVII